MSAQPEGTASLHARDDNTAGVRMSTDTSAAHSEEAMRALLHRTIDDVLSIAEQVLGGGSRGLAALSGASDIAGLARSVMSGSTPSVWEMSRPVSGVAGGGGTRTSGTAPRTSASGGLSLKARAGESTSGQVDVSNDSKGPLDNLDFLCPGLAKADAQAEVIGANVKITPQRLHVCPGLSSKVTVTVTVPDGTAEGTYLGWLAVRGRPSIHLPLTLEVE